MPGFSLAKKAVGIYFNDGELIVSCQVDKGNPPTEKLIYAIKAARAIFLTLCHRNCSPEVLAKLDAVVKDLM